MRRLRHATSALAACALLAACQDSTGAGPRDALRFTYEGAVDGAFEARGAFPGSALRDQRSFAVAVDLGGVVGEGTLSVIAWARHGGATSADVANVVVGDLGAGTYTCTAATVRAGVCPFRIAFALGVRGGGGADADFEHAASQLRLLERTESRIRGTFTGTFATGDGRQVTVQDGTFDAGIVPFEEYVGRDGT